MGACATLVLSVLVAAAPASAAGVTLFVATTGSDTGDCQVAACASVGYALSQAPSGATISVGAGTFMESELIPQLPVTIQGAGAGTTIIDADTSNTSCSTTYSSSALYLVGTGVCSGPALPAGTYALDDLTLEGTGGASASAEPILINIEGLPSGTTVDLDNVDLLTNSTVDPNLDDDFAVGLYAAGAEQAVEVNLADDTLTGFYQSVFFEAYAGQAEVSASSFDLSPAEYAGDEYPPQGVYLLSDGSAQMNASMTGPFDISGNTFSGYSGYGVFAQAGYAPDSLTGSLSSISVTDNTFDLPAVLDPGTSALTSPVVLTTDDSTDQLSEVQITGNSVTTSGAGAADIGVNGPETTANITNLDVTGNDLLGGTSVVGVDNASGSPVAAIGNYWGDLMGPSGTGPGTGTQAPTGLDFSRWCTTPTPSCPSVPAPPASAAAIDPSGEAQVSWAVPPTDGDQPITGYTVVAQDETNNSTGPAQPVAASDLSAVVPGLTPGDTYTFAVSGVNVVGTGLPTVSNAVTIPEAPPPTTTTTLTPTTTTMTTTTTDVTPSTTPLKPFPPSNVSYPNGAIVFFGHTGYVFAGGRAFGVPTQKVLAAVQKVDPATIMAAPSGANPPVSTPPRSGVFVFTSPVNGNPEIYVVGTDGELHGFATPNQLLRDGYDVALIVTVPNLGGLEVGSAAGATLTALATKADGAIVNSSGTFFTFAGGKAFGIPTPAELTRIRKANPAAVLTAAVTPAETSAPVASGALLSVSPTVYVSYNGAAYPFKTTAQLDRAGYGGTAGVPTPHTGGLPVVFPYSGAQ